MRSLSRSQRAFAVTLGFVGLCAVMPTGWLGWTAVVADVVSVPIQPLTDLGVRISSWVRPGGGVRQAVALQRRDEELETTRALLHAARLRIEALLEEIEALQEARRFHPAVQMTPLYARVTARPPDRASGPVRLNAGRRHGVRAGAIAIYRGGHLVGRIADGVSRLSSRLVPLTDPSTGLIEAMILPADEPLADTDAAPRIQLSPDERGGLTGDLDRAIPISRGDVVRLADPGWPQSAQGLILGTVESVETNERRPLLASVTVKPRFEAQRLDSVTLIVERISDLSLGGERP